MNPLISYIENAGLGTPWFYLALFVGASLLMIWRLEAMSGNGFEGTVLGTLIMPYCSGIGNLIFAVLLGMRGGSGTDVMTNCLVNNVTNLSLLIGLPAVLWGLTVVPQKKVAGKKKNNNQAPQLNRLSLLLTMAAVVFFTSVVWALARDGKINFTDGLVLVGLFLFWQCIHVFEVMKNNVRQNKSLGAMIIFDLLLLGIGAYGIYLSIDWLVNWLGTIKTGFISGKQLGWLSGWLMVLPNALIALYYGWRRRAEVIYSSQIGDGHICIPLCIGLFALFRPITIPSFFDTSALILIAATVVHFIFIGMFGRLPRFMGLALIGAYGIFLYHGLVG